MVLRAFGAFDNEAFTVTDDSPSLSPDSPIINNSNTPVGTIFEYAGGFPVRNIILDDTSDEPDIFNDNEEDEHVIVDGKGLVDNGTEVESESYHYVRQLDDDGDPFGPRITITVFSKDGDFTEIWGMSTDTPLIDGARYVKVGGSNKGDSAYDSFVLCFTAGALIATDRGERPVETLRAGDRVVTRDNGFQEIRWIGTCTVSVAAQLRDRHKRAIVVRKDALGPGLPHTDVSFSPNHRLLLNQPEVNLLYSDTEVFASAKDLVKQRGIGRMQAAEVTYVHLLFDRHEAILANGIWSESFLPGDYTLGSLEFAQHREILSLFPELDSAHTPTKPGFAPARRILKRHEVSAVA